MSRHLVFHGGSLLNNLRQGVCGPNLKLNTNMVKDCAKIRKKLYQTGVQPPFPKCNAMAGGLISAKMLLSGFGVSLGFWVKCRQNLSVQCKSNELDEKKQDIDFVNLIPHLLEFFVDIFKALFEVFVQILFPKPLVKVFVKHSNKVISHMAADS